MQFVQLFYVFSLFLFEDKQIFKFVGVDALEFCTILKLLFGSFWVLKLHYVSLYGYFIHFSILKVLWKMCDIELEEKCNLVLEAGGEMQPNRRWKLHIEVTHFQAVRWDTTHYALHSLYTNTPFK